jgi:hypothetical protein
MSFQIMSIPISIRAKNCLTVSKTASAKDQHWSPRVHASCLVLVMAKVATPRTAVPEIICGSFVLPPPGRRENDESHVPIRGTRSRFVQRGFGVLRFLIAGFRFTIDRCKSQIRNLKSAIRYPRVEAESAQPAG